MWVTARPSHHARKVVAIVSIGGFAIGSTGSRRAYFPVRDGRHAGDRIVAEMRAEQGNVQRLAKTDFPMPPVGVWMAYPGRLLAVVERLASRVVAPRRVAVHAGDQCGHSQHVAGAPPVRLA